MHNAIRLFVSQTELSRNAPPKAPRRRITSRSVSACARERAARRIDPSAFTRIGSILLFALIAVLALASSSARAAPADVREIREVVPFDKNGDRFGRVTELPPDIKTPPSSPLQVRLLASEAPALNEPVTITLQTHAFENAPGTDVTIRLPEGAEVVEGSPRTVVDLEAGQTHELTVVARLTKRGEQAIEGRAFRAVTDEASWGDDDALYLTVERGNGFVGYRSAADTELEAIPVSDKLAGEPREVPAEGGTVEGGGQSPPQPPPEDGGGGSDPDPGEPVDVSICWALERSGTAAIPFRDATVEFMDDDTGGPDDVLASGITDYINGCASATVLNGDEDAHGQIDVYVRLKMEHPGRYRIQNLAGAVFSCKTTTQNDVAANLNLGTWRCGGPAGNARAAWIYDDIYRLRRFVEEHRAGKGDPPGQCTAQWQTDSTTGTLYRLSDARVHLAGTDADYIDVVVHECAHRYMHVAYGGGWPLGPSCPSPHPIHRASGPSCAWSEGWTYVLVAGAEGNPVYTDYDEHGQTRDRNLETPSCLDRLEDWHQGPTVEGRVGGVLIDLLDPFTLSFAPVYWFANEPFIHNNGPGPFLAGCDGGDDQAGLFGSFWEVFTGQNDDVFVAQGNQINSFSRAWRAAGQQPGRADGLYDQSGRFICFRRGGNCVGGLNSIPTFGVD